MNRRTVTVDSRLLLVAVDDPAPTAERWRAVATGRAVDELTERPVTTIAVRRISRRGVSSNTAGDGAFCFVARPWIAFPPLQAPSYAFTAAIEADSYLPTGLTLTVSSGQRLIAAPPPAVGNPVLALNNVAALTPGQLLAIGPANTQERGRILHLGPGPQQITMEGGLGLVHNIGDPVVADAWTPIDVGRVPLRRRPIVIRGRTVRRDAASNTVTPVPNASVVVTDFWFTLAAVRAQLPGAMTDPNPAARAFLAAVSPGLVADRPTPGGQVARQTLVPVAADDRFLPAAANAGDRTFRISNRQNIAAGVLLRIDPDRPEIAESVIVAGVQGFDPPDGPGDVTLALPFSTVHRPSTRTMRLTPQPPAPPAALRRDALGGDRTIFVSDLTNLPDNVDVGLTGGPAPAEFQRLRRVEATSDADGYFQLPPVHRVAALRFLVTAAALTPVDLTQHPDYSQPENWIDVVFA